jgi:hypothetical protein
MKKIDECSMGTRQYLSLLIILVVFVSVLIPGNAYAQTKRANFSGTWIFNELKSKFVEGRGFRNIVRLTVTQSGNKLSVLRARVSLNGDTTYFTEKYTLDGKESVNNTSRGPSKTILTWSGDKQTLIFAVERSFEWKGETTTLKSGETWNLGDPKTLIIIPSLTMQDGEKKGILVYDKK